MASVWRLPIVLLLLSVALSPLPSSAAFVRPIRLTHTGPIRVAHQPQPTPRSAGGRPVTALSAGRFNLKKHLSQRDIACVNVGALSGVLISRLLFLTAAILVQYIAAIDISSSGQEIVIRLASVEVDAAAVLSRFAATTLLVVPIIVFWWSKIPESSTIPRDRDVPSDVQLLENSSTRPAAGETAIRLRDRNCVGLGITVGCLLYSYFEAFYAVASYSMGGAEGAALVLSAMLTFALPTLFWGNWIAFLWKAVAYDDE
ncbi:unnamed protein product [Vitrella brassicaformis CCMP3155]|uniref:Uncharacterized protein n=2 Tax=Vitrella brassicaformis TaxID=1169539 RepID=A0A0G4FMC7_VITBC|nr:unnamed protein product [Vitrella brassicaformis CCMP3155]|eukprot:CEM15206.1 unnamed protein product [Vitrella brassicaformis CCMP3155]